MACVWDAPNHYRSALLVVIPTFLFSFSLNFVCNSTMGLSIESNNKNGLFGQLGQNNSKIARLTSFLILLKNNLIWSLLPFWFVSLQKHHLSTYFINFIFSLLISFKLFFSLPRSEHTPSRYMTSSLNVSWNFPSFSFHEHSLWILFSIFYAFHLWLIYTFLRLWGSLS